MTAEQRFWAKVRKGDVCWNWTGAISSGGYGNFYTGGGRAAARHVHAHRFAYELLIDPIPEGMCLDHLCRNRKCVNPDHLEVVTRGENVLRGDTLAGRAARATKCKHGHPFDVANTYITREGHRHCRACGRRRALEKARRAGVPPRWPDRDNSAREFGLVGMLENDLARAA